MLALTSPTRTALIEALQAAGFQQGATFTPYSFGRTESFYRSSAPVEVQVRSEYNEAGVVEALTVVIHELDPFGYKTEAQHTSSYVRAAHVAPIVAFATALADELEAARLASIQAAR